MTRPELSAALAAHRFGLGEANLSTVGADPVAWLTAQIHAAEPQRFDLLVTDQTMPRLSGAQLATRIRELRRDLPVVMMTGYSATIDEHKARELGIQTYLCKPVNGDELLAAVVTALQRATTAKT